MNIFPAEQIKQHFLPYNLSSILFLKFKLGFTVVR